MPGDILLRRYITPRVSMMDRFAHPYFTHSAFYIGNGDIVEAVGTEKRPVHDIQINSLLQSDWMDSEIESWVIVRPKNIAGKFEVIKKDMTAIALDSGYSFGLPKFGNKTTTCADLVFTQLRDKRVIDISNPPQIITPDYLFWVALHDQTDFEIIGYGI